MPVEVLGFAGTPEASDRLAVVETEARARELTDYRVRQERDKSACDRSAERDVSDTRSKPSNYPPLLLAVRDEPTWSRRRRRSLGIPGAERLLDPGDVVRVERLARRMAVRRPIARPSRSRS